MDNGTPPAEPWKITSIQYIRSPSYEERLKCLKEAGWNPFMIKAENVYIDLLSDSGSGSMSDDQWAALMRGDESYASRRNFFTLVDKVREIFGFENIIPAHQGRAAENVLFSTIVKKGDVVPNNTHFDTTQANIEQNGGIALNLPIKELYDFDHFYPFKGNMDVKKLKETIDNYGAQKIPVVMLTITNNSGGGQPVSMENIKKVSKICKKSDLLFFFDACRFAENAYFIKQREKGYKNWDIRRIVKKMFSYVDGCNMSAKKDMLCNIGGFIGLKKSSMNLYNKLATKCLLVEGFKTYGGITGRDLEAMAVGLEEGVNCKYLDWRISQVRRLGEQLKKAGVPIIWPTGGHAIYILSQKFFPHIPPTQYPGQVLFAMLYLEGGIRGAELGNVAFGKRDPQTKKETFPKLDLFRLAIPRRLYTNSHIDYVAQKIISLYKNRKKYRGFNIVYETPYLRHFIARFEPLRGKNGSS
ncbi:TPA: tryptophanase [archaeon]|uniref:Tryptophanase n=1 Tax=Candidatus Naiadarchaeum limnaeum TaxID=2756139 RepID=A0A832UZD9_9ARCH|nr:tryptophanase [Candidatus Naiadarchaeales archaeon SRR2090153.bin1042]HIK00109.1 tryptophanase [Candidatus Naiadarchaeum limnaeum]